MMKENKWRNKRVRSLIVLCALMAVLVGVTTYAWFVGLQEVNVEAFEVEIAAAEGLSLSLDGDDFSETVTITEGTLDDVSPAVHSNKWSELKPMSTIGEMDEDTSKMKLFEKSSFTATPGGYRIMVAQVENEDDEQDGYVVFDLYIKNISGTEYDADWTEADEEGIYLTTNSVVTVADGGTAGTGIENSVRVAFTQIGRVKSDSAAEVVTGITCASDTNVTGICRDAQIWEPNDKAHVKGAISWYEESCLARTNPASGEEGGGEGGEGVVSDVTDPDSYEGECGIVVDGLAYKTYAANADIKSSDHVNQYDGEDYNGYEGTTKLEAVDTYTDTEKLEKSTKRTEFMTLAANSITKVRVYIYLEGQDIDNYDLSSIGKMITINFGFTKQRFTESDIGYDGEDVNQGEGPEANDTTKPVITLDGDEEITLVAGAKEEFEEPGFEATDNIDGDITEDVVESGTINTKHPGVYTRIYTVKDAAGNVGVATRTITVVASEGGGQS